MPTVGALVISLDLELHWGVRDKMTIGKYRDQFVAGRDAVIAILRSFSEFGVHATWATVGLLFFETKREMLAAVPARTPAYARPTLSPYDEFASVGENEREDPFHFAPSLIRRIAETPGQEIGTHTFSHYYCLEAGQREADFREDLRAAVEVARKKLGYAPRSIVFPRNQLNPAYTAVCRELGLIAYRGNLDHWAYRARAGVEPLARRAVRLADTYVPLSGLNALPLTVAPAGNLVEIPATRYLRPYAPAGRWLEPIRLRRIVRDMEDAAGRRRCFHLWWHPHEFGNHLGENLRVLRCVLTHLARLRDTYGMETLTMAEAAQWALTEDGHHPSSDGEHSDRPHDSSLLPQFDGAVRRAG